MYLKCYLKHFGEILMNSMFEGDLGISLNIFYSYKNNFPHFSLFVVTCISLNFYSFNKYKAMTMCQALSDTAF